MKSVVLILTVMFGDGQTLTQSYFYDTMQECRAIVGNILKNSPLTVTKASCHRIIPEVPMVEPERQSRVG